LIGKPGKRGSMKVNGRKGFEKGWSIRLNVYKNGNVSNKNRTGHSSLDFLLDLIKNNQMVQRTILEFLKEIGKYGEI
jgi:hypothetical protein